MIDTFAPNHASLTCEEVNFQFILFTKHAHVAVCSAMRERLKKQSVINMRCLKIIGIARLDSVTNEKVWQRTEVRRKLFQSINQTVQTGVGMW